MSGRCQVAETRIACRAAEGGIHLLPIVVKFVGNTTDRRRHACGAQQTSGSERDVACQLGHAAKHAGQTGSGREVASQNTGSELLKGWKSSQSLLMELPAVSELPRKTVTCPGSHLSQFHSSSVPK